MKKAYSVLFLFLFLFYCQSVFAGKEIAKPISKTWQEFSSPEKLIDIKYFLDNGYQEAFWRRVGELNDQFKISPAAAGCSAYWAQLGARYLAWHLEFRKNYLFNFNEGLSGDSNYYVISLIDSPENNSFLDCLKETKNQEQACSLTIYEMVNEVKEGILPFLDILGVKNSLLVMAYNADINILRIDKNILLPPGIWMALLNHQERHALDDIYNRNQMLTDIEVLAELDAAAIADGIYTWKIFRDDFLKIWMKKRLDFKPEYIVAKICLADILLAEPLFEQDLKNQKPEHLKEYSRKLFLR